MLVAKKGEGTMSDDDDADEMPETAKEAKVSISYMQASSQKKPVISQSNRI